MTALQRSIDGLSRLVEAETVAESFPAHPSMPWTQATAARTVGTLTACAANVSIGLVQRVLPAVVLDLTELDVSAVQIRTLEHGERGPVSIESVTR